LVFGGQVFFFMVPIGIALWYGVGYASLATISVGIVAMILFSYRALYADGSWAYIYYGILLEIIVIWALRPNIKRLMNGTERLVGWRAKRNRNNSTNPE
jgi:glycerol-3-phosphate acyltransferase PlsY